jgi:hypothetical protein
MSDTDLDSNQIKIRIRIRITSGSASNKKLNLDPHQSDAAPQHWTHHEQSLIGKDLTMHEIREEKDMEGKGGTWI